MDSLPRRRIVTLGEAVFDDVSAAMTESNRGAAGIPMGLTAPVGGRR